MPISEIYHSRQRQVRRSHQGSPVRHRKASAGERRRRSWGSWRALEHMSLSLGENPPRQKKKQNKLYILNERNATHVVPLTDDGQAFWFSLVNKYVNNISNVICA